MLWNSLQLAMTIQVKSCLLMLCMTGTILGLPSENPFAVDSNEDNEWSEWKEDTECSRTCGVGLQYLRRECLLLGSDGSPLCNGEDKILQTCNIQDCPPGSKDFRDVQCEDRYKDLLVDNIRQEWTHHYLDSEPCTLYCRPKGGELLYKTTLIDGTPCRFDDLDVCVNGTCMAVGCDRKLGSSLRFDRCMICDGNSTDCRVKSGEILLDKLETGYNEVLGLPVGATSIKVEDNEASKNYIAVKDRHGLYHLNGHFLVSDDINKTIGGAYFRYRTLPDGRRSLTASGPLKFPIYIDVLKQPGAASSIYYEFAVPGNSDTVYSTIPEGMDIGTTDLTILSGTDVVQEVPSPIQPPEESNFYQNLNGDEFSNDYEGVEWITSDWSECRTCQDRISTRKVLCFSKSDPGLKIRPDAKCSSQSRPSAQRPCPTYSPTSCVKRPEWIASEWSKCSSSCGRGYQYRKVYCVKQQQDSNQTLHILPSSQCEPGRRMETERTCEGDCQAFWMSGQYGACSRSCGGGIRRRLVLCLSSKREVEVTACGVDTRPAESEPCNEKNCSVEESRDCKKSKFGCCPDGVQSASGPESLGCTFSRDPIPPGLCLESTHGCCLDGLTPAQGPKQEGCHNVSASTETVHQEPEGHTTDIDSDTDLSYLYEPTQEGRPDGLIDHWDPVSTMERSHEVDDDTVRYDDADDDTHKYDDATRYDADIDDTEASGFDLLATTDSMELVSTTARNIDDTTEIHTISYSSEMTTTIYDDNDDESITAAYDDDDVDGTDDDLLDDCTLTMYGCCPDGLTKAEGPQLHGCLTKSPVTESSISCENSFFGCCEDGTTSASGLHQEGCPEFSTTTILATPTQGVTSAITSPTTSITPTSQTIPTVTTSSSAEAPRHSTTVTTSLSCADSPYGCCLDGYTPAQGVNFTGCADNNAMHALDCRDSGFGCCSDGKTPASGPHGLGCPNTPGGECSLPRETGPCSNYAVQWFFDTSVGDCTRFWYGGCDGNGNRFHSQEECKQRCISPVGIRRCFLPVSTGRCRASMRKFYYNPTEGQCKEFTYGGCHGNDNRFDTMEICQEECGNQLSTDVCSQPYMPGPCRGQYQRWFFDSSNKICRPFTYGGCLGNDNRFMSLQACQQRCTKSAEDVCSLDAETGPCLGRFIAWHYNKSAGSCQQFVYGGCDGNENRFENEELCKQKCSHSSTVKTKTVDRCALAMNTGPCLAYFERWWYDSSDGLCKQFVYGGCEGNENRFKTELECRKTCNAKQPVDICTLTSDPGPCDNYIVQWFYDQDLDQCRRFWFGGCDGNENRFSTSEECLKRCQKTTTTTETITTTVATTSSRHVSAESLEVCSQSKDSGPCQRPMLRWYFDQAEGRCLRFAYGGCEGNKNRFLTEELCLEKCSGSRIHTSPGSTSSTHVATPLSGVPGLPSTRIGPAQPTANTENDISRCKLERDVGPCSADQKRWFYDVTVGSCRNFIYGGCGGNANNFYTEVDCRQTCEEPMRGENGIVAPPTAAEAVCDRPRDRGSCYGEVLRYYYDASLEECRPFIYGGCNGNGNNFATPSDCYSVCGGSSEPDRGIELGAKVRRLYDPLDCFEPVVGGPCFDYEIRYHYKQEASDCLAFYYGGCEGNTNNFRSYDDCIALCSKASAQRHCAPLECGLSCPYGYIKGDDGCHRCQCYSPCEAHSCPSHMECHVEEVQCLSYPCPEPRPACRLREKVGVCPTEADSFMEVMVRSRRCSRECGVDSDCDGTFKCCPAQSCGMLCMPPVFPPASEKPGHCPTVRLTRHVLRRARRCSRECQTDVDCEGSSKCCPAGSCGTICIQPAQAEEQPNYGQYIVPQMSAVEGDSTILPTCRTRSYSNDDVTWFKDNKELDHNSTNEGYEITDRGLKLTNVTSQHAAMYTCRHSHQLQSYSFSVNVPARFKQPDDSYQEYLVGQMITITCDGEGEPQPTVTWLRDGGPFRQDYEHILHGDDVVIRRAELKDSSVYQCLISNGFGGRQTKRFFIKVVESFTATLTSNSTSNESFSVGDDAQLVCDVEGPSGTESSLEWTHNGVPLAFTGVFRDERYELDSTREILTIRDVISDDAGEFACDVIRKLEDGTKLTASSSLNVTIEQVGAPENCTDKPWYANCELILEARLCRHPYFSIFCCKTCYQAGHLP